MRNVRRTLFLVLVAVLLIGLLPGVTAQDMTPVKLQLKWVTQAQFAGYYAALNEGYYAEVGLDVEILPGGPDISPQQVVAAGGAEFGIDWMGSHLASREAGSGTVVIAQVFQRSGMRELTWADSGLETIADLEGRKVGVWGFGNQSPLFAALVKEGLDHSDPNDVEIVNQPFDMNLLLNREVDAAAAMTYNEMAQVLETVGEDGSFPLYTLEDLNVIDLNEVGTAMLEDNIFARDEWLAEEGSADIAVRFIGASMRGWIFCRDNPDTCVDYVLAEGSTLGAGHQRWMMSEINKLVWPSPSGVGIMDPALYDQTAAIALNYEVVTAEPENAWRNDLAEAALSWLQGNYPDEDPFGLEWQAATVEITPGGE
ncbi:MAG TPA: ABC transporter substrate-binding protein [Aggregatilineales bacterium]|nr:ABC transporter substrate-binding protein [Aggregatilineales bacterium]